MLHPVACGIVAGGASTRMGTNKALLPFRGRPLLARQLEILTPLFRHVLIGANDPVPYAGFGLPVVADRLSQPCALTGIHALIAASPTPHVFVVACDMPFLNPALIEDLLRRREGKDAVVPESDRGLEPLHAVYARSCLAALEEGTREGRWKATDFHARAKVERVRVRDADWLIEGRSPFLNANTPEEWRDTAP